MKVRTHGYRTKRELLARDGKPKVCIRCDLWFLAAPRERVCLACLRPSELALRAVKDAAKVITHGSLNGRQNPQVRGVDYCPWRSEYRRRVYPELAGIHARLIREGKQGCVCWKLT